MKTQQKNASKARQIAAGKRCYDCGSTIPNRHTRDCEMAEEGAVLDLPQRKNTQHWNGELPLTE